MADSESSSTAKFALIAAAIAAAPPLTAAVHGWVSGYQQAEAKKIEQDFKMRTELLDRAIDPKSPPQDRQKVLRLVVNVIEDKPMKEWAQAELNRVDIEVKARQERHRILKDADDAANGRTAGTEKYSINDCEPGTIRILGGEIEPDEALVALCNEPVRTEVEVTNTGVSALSLYTGLDTACTCRMKPMGDDRVGSPDRLGIQ